MSSYHGWWGDVQPGVGNPTPARETYTLNDLSQASLRVLRRRRDIACVLVNPLQALHPNGGAPSDSALVDSGRRAHFDKAAYGAWLAKLRQVCSERNIVLIFDEVFSGFRLAAGGAQAYFGVQADLVTYGKTLGGGLPIGALCGRKDLMVVAMVVPALLVQHVEETGHVPPVVALRLRARLACFSSAIYHDFSRSRCGRGPTCAKDTDFSHG